MEIPLSATIEQFGQSSGLNYATPDSRSDRQIFGVNADTWIRVLVITGLFAAAFWPNLRRLWLKTNPFFGEANWSHSVFVPLVGLYYLFIHREDLIDAGPVQFVWGRFLRRSRLQAALVMLLAGGGLTALAWQSSSLMFAMVRAIGIATAMLGFLVLLVDWSFGTIFFGLGLFVYGIYPGQNDYLKDVGMIVTLFGIVLMLTGPRVMRIAWFPIVFLICAIPWPGLVYSWVAEPLSQMAARVAVGVLKLTGVEAMTSGTKILILDFNSRIVRTLNVEEACAGMRSLMTFISIGGAIAFLSARPLWQKLTIMFSAVPIAISCNMARISGQGLLDHYVSQKWSESFAHQFVGMMMLLPAFFLLLLVGYVLDKLFIEEAEEGDSNFTVRPKTVAALAPKQAWIPGSDAYTDAAIVPAAQVAAGMTPAVMAPITPPVVETAAPAPEPAPIVNKPAVAVPAMAAPRAIVPPAAKPIVPPVARPAAIIPPRPAVAATAATPVAPAVIRPAGGVPPRPVTPANPRPATAGTTPPRPALGGQSMRLPPRPSIGGVQRVAPGTASQSPGQSPAAARPAAVQPNQMNGTTPAPTQPAPQPTTTTPAEAP